MLQKSRSLSIRAFCLFIKESKSSQPINQRAHDTLKVKSVCSRLRSNYWNGTPARQQEQIICSLGDMWTPLPLRATSFSPLIAFDSCGLVHKHCFWSRMGSFVLKKYFFRINETSPKCFTGHNSTKSVILLKHY
jgi:hypothetical protein